MSSQITMISNYPVSNLDSFKSSLMNALGAESSLQDSIQAQLSEIAKTAEKSKLKGGVISIESVIKPQANSTSDTITITVDKGVSTLTIPASVSMELDVTVVDSVPAEGSESGVAISVSTSKVYPLDGVAKTGITQVITALNSFAEGQSFDAQITSATMKDDATTASATASPSP